MTTSTSEGYSGADVLKMNVRSLCFARVARERGEPWLWWDFVDRLGDDRPMKEGKFTEECAHKVFDAVAGPNVGSADGRAAWLKCSDVGTPDARGSVPLLDDELKSQTGTSSGAGAVAILSTVRINGRQYRGNLDAGAVLRALCAAFPNVVTGSVVTEDSSLPMIFSACLSALWDFIDHLWPGHAGGEDAPGHHCAAAGRPSLAGGPSVVVVLTQVPAPLGAFIGPDHKSVTTERRAHMCAHLLAAM